MGGEDVQELREMLFRERERRLALEHERGADLIEIARLEDRLGGPSAMALCGGPDRNLCGSKSSSGSVPTKAAAERNSSPRGGQQQIRGSLEKAVLKSAAMRAQTPEERADADIECDVNARIAQLQSSTETYERLVGQSRMKAPSLTGVRFGEAEDRRRKLVRQGGDWSQGGT